MCVGGGGGVVVATAVAEVDSHVTKQYIVHIFLLLEVHPPIPDVYFHNTTYSTGFHTTL